MGRDEVRLGPAGLAVMQTCWAVDAERSGKPDEAHLYRRMAVRNLREAEEGGCGLLCLGEEDRTARVHRGLGDARRGEEE